MERIFLYYSHSVCVSDSAGAHYRIADSQMLKKWLVRLSIFQLSPFTTITQLELILIWFYTQTYYQGIVP